MATTWTSAFGRACGWLLDRIVHGLALTQISPNVLTFIGLVINIVAAVFFGRANATNAGRMFMYAGLVIIGAGIFDMVDGRVARRNNQVTVFDTTKEEEIVYKLVTSEESDVSKGLISTTSPIGRGLIGKQVGDTATVVTPNGKRELEILKLVTIHDEVALAEGVPDEAVSNEAGLDKAGA